MVTLEVVHTRQAREERWNEFLAGLKPWELHRLAKDEQELIMHDAYVDGETTLKAIRLDLSFAPQVYQEHLEESAEDGSDPRA